MGCKKIATCYLNVLNGVVLIASLGIIGYSSFLASTLDDFKEIVDEGAILTPLVGGCVLFLLGALGYVSVMYKSKILLVVYLIGVLAVTVTVLIAGFLLLTLSGTLENINSNSVQNSANSLEARAVDFQLAVFERCCNLEFNLGAEVQLCNEVTLTGCFNDQERFEKFNESIPEQLCDALAEVNINGVPLVGNPAVNNGCANGDAALFTENISQFLTDNLYPLGGVNIALAVLLLVDLVAGFIVLCSKDDRDLDKLPTARFLD